MQNSFSKILVIIVLALIVGIGGSELYKHRHYEEEIVAGPGVTEVKKMSDWFAPLKGTMNDGSVFILEGENPGVTALFLGGTHPCEIAGVIAAMVLIENAQVSAGRLIVIPHANRSGSTGTMPSGGFPLYYSFTTTSGYERTFRMGDRNTHPLDSWPDPDVFTHYPSKQKLSYVEDRNLNRCFPGRENGFVTEKVAYAITQIIRQENVVIEFDMHEAETLYPVTNCIVAPYFLEGNRSGRYASNASIQLGDKFAIKVEPSPPGLRGLSHRELGDPDSGGVAGVFTFLLEAPEPFLDQPTGPKTVDLLLNGRDEFIDDLSKRGKLFVDYNYEEGKTMELRVGRHIETTFALFDQFSVANPDMPLYYTCPAYDAIMENGLGAYLLDPNDSANTGRVYSDWQGKLIR